MIELLVSISIVVLVLSITLSRHSSFNAAVLLRSQAYEVALDMRQVQLSAVSSTNDNLGDFYTTLGVYFDTANANEYLFFRDLDDDNFYSAAAAPSEEVGAKGVIDPRFEIRDIRTVGGGSITNNNVSVVFKRPNFDALFYNSANTQLTTATAVEIEIGLKDSTGGDCGSTYRTVRISSAGQVTVLECS